MEELELGLWGTMKSKRPSFTWQVLSDTTFNFDKF